MFGVTLTDDYRENRLDLVPLVSGDSWSLDRENLWRLPGAHGEEVVRSVYLDEQVCWNSRFFYFLLEGFMALYSVILFIS